MYTYIVQLFEHLLRQTIQNKHQAPKPGLYRLVSNSWVFMSVVQVSSTKVFIFLIQNLYMTIFWIRNIKIFVEDTRNIFWTNDVHKLLFYDIMKI